MWRFSTGYDMQQKHENAASQRHDDEPHHLPSLGAAV
jgi:hypothetical protein